MWRPRAPNGIVRHRADICESQTITILSCGSARVALQRSNNSGANQSAEGIVERTVVPACLSLKDTLRMEIVVIWAIIALPLAVRGHACVDCSEEGGS